jgi:hypothetical protein
MLEQTADGYWGEHRRNGPTIGYNHLTLSAVAVYHEHSGDREVLPALRRATDFHKNYSFLDGTSVDVINDRNRRWRSAHGANSPSLTSPTAGSSSPIHWPSTLWAASRRTRSTIMKDHRRLLRSR